MSRPSSLVQTWVNRWQPSARVGTDPLGDCIIEGRYRPTTVANFKLIPAMAARMLAARKPAPLTFSHERRLTVVIPMRDREEHLRQLVPQLHSTLQAQLSSFQVLVVEQEQGRLFNRGKLLNVGMHYAASRSDYYCLHDVDMLPLESNYAAPSQPLRLVNVLETTWRGSSVFAPHYFAGVVTISKEQVFAANGFSNEYWGWGKEDDDLHFRLLLAGHVCFFDERGRYHDLPNPAHQRVAKIWSRPPAFLRKNRARKSLLLRGLLDPATDGLSTLSFQVLRREANESYEKIVVRI